jgi:F-type H+/Na+-transporting ATPase subunit alpha
MDIKESVLKELDKRISDFTPVISKINVGKVKSVVDGVATISGLSNGRIGEVVSFQNNEKGLLLNLKKDECGIVVFGAYENINEGDSVKSTGEILNITVSDAFMGRVINPLGESIDGKGNIVHKTKSKKMMVERIAPGIVDRSPVVVPLQTGIKAIDSMVPIGRGQRELIIGDRNTGKTAIAIDTIINQERLNSKKGAKTVISIYVAIGQKQSKISQVVEKLVEENAFKNVIIVAANSSDPVALQYIAPYSGSAIAEYFMERGEDVLIVYDDLTKHAWAYRQISLVLHRPSGREAYPGDIFYLHSKLLERSCKLNDKNGGGSITALPIIETQAQDISAYIPTNVISITDGQIYLESSLFYQGVRPAINAGLSVSRVGGAAQLRSVKQVAGKLRLEIAQYNELAAFSQFGSELDNVSKSKIERGKRITEIFKQQQYKPLAVEKEVLIIWAVTKGYLDQISVEECNDKSAEFADFVLYKDSKIAENIKLPAGMSKELEIKLESIATKFFKK